MRYQETFKPFIQVKGEVFLLTFLWFIEGKETVFLKPHAGL